MFKIAFLIFLFLFTTQSKLYSVGEWEYVGKNSLEDNFYFNTFIEAQPIQIFENNILSAHVGTIDSIRLIQLIEYSEFLTNNRVNYNYEIKHLYVDCVSYKAASPNIYYFNQSSKPISYNQVVDYIEEDFYAPHLENFKDMPGFTDYFKKKCNQFYSQPKFVGVDGKVEHGEESQEIKDLRCKFRKSVGGTCD